MRVLVLQHAASEGPGTLGTFLNSRGVDLRICQIYRGEPIPPGPVDASAIIILGGPQSVVAGKEPPFFPAEAAFLSEALRREIPVLGVCLGAQILARVCGARVTRASTVEIGWSRVKLTPEGLRDPLFHGVDGSFDVFQWHEDMFDIPRGATRLIEGDICRNQAFRWGRNAYGLQFHVEVTPEMIGEWFDAGGRPGSAAPSFHPSVVQTARLIYLNLLGNILRHRPLAHPERNLPMKVLRPPIPVRSEAEHRLLRNSFVAGLRRLRVHQEEYVALCDALRELARHWRGCDLIDREVAAALHELASALRDMVPVLARTDPGCRDELEDMANTIHRLIRDCYRRGP